MVHWKCLQALRGGLLDGSYTGDVPWEGVVDSVLTHKIYILMKLHVMMGYCVVVGYCVANGYYVV